jgi:hypothetical protein
MFPTPLKIATLINMSSDHKKTLQEFRSNSITCFGTENRNFTLNTAKYPRNEIAEALDRSKSDSSSFPKVTDIWSSSTTNINN